MDLFRAILGEEAGDYEEIQDVMRLVTEAQWRSWAKNDEAWRSVEMRRAFEYDDDRLYRARREVMSMTRREVRRLYRARMKHYELRKSRGRRGRSHFKWVNRKGFKPINMLRRRY